jgi:hypothetical protein
MKKQTQRRKCSVEENIGQYVELKQGKVLKPDKLVRLIDFPFNFDNEYVKRTESIII